MKFDFTKLREPFGLINCEAPISDFTGGDTSLLSHFLERLDQVREEMSRARMVLRAEYERRRRCTEVKPNGEPCKAWAVWNAEEQKCLGHLSPTARAAHEATKCDRPRRPVCDCTAYPFPHRPGNGFCLAPEAPLMVHPLEAGKRRAGRKRRRDQKRSLKRVLAKIDRI